MCQDAAPFAKTTLPSGVLRRVGRLVDQTSRDPKAFLSQRGEKGVHVLENDVRMLIRHDVTPVRNVDDHSRRQRLAIKAVKSGLT